MDWITDGRKGLAQSPVQVVTTCPDGHVVIALGDRGGKITAHTHMTANRAEVVAHQLLEVVRRLRETGGRVH